DAGLLGPDLRLGLGLGEPGPGEVGELEALCEGDPAAGHGDRRKVDETLGGLQLAQVVEHLAGGAPAAGGDEAAALELLLVAGRVDESVMAAERRVGQLPLGTLDAREGQHGALTALSPGESLGAGDGRLGELVDILDDAAGGEALE